MGHLSYPSPEPRELVSSNQHQRMCISASTSYEQGPGASRGPVAHRCGDLFSRCVCHAKSGLLANGHTVP